jgi:hypothetical protein
LRNLAADRRFKSIIGVGFAQSARERGCNTFDVRSREALHDNACAAQNSDVLRDFVFIGHKNP